MRSTRRLRRGAWASAALFGALAAALLVRQPLARDLDEGAGAPTSVRPAALAGDEARPADAPHVEAKPDNTLAALDAWVCGASLEEGAPEGGARDFLPEAADPTAPWAAKLEIIEERFGDGAMTVSNCGAAAVAPGWLLTAAHCVGQEGWISVRATLGAKDSSAASAVRRSVSAAICHERFDPRNLSHDVALLRLDRPLPPDFPLLRLASQKEALRLKPGDAALSAGWGRVSKREISRVLRKAAVRVVDPARAGDGMIVAAPIRHEESLCVGESGAPLVADLGEGQALFGVFSSVDAYFDKRSGEMVELCHGFEARSYFTALGSLRGWIDSVIKHCDAGSGRCSAQ